MHSMAPGCNTSSFVVSNMMYYKIAAEIFKHDGSFYHVRATQIVTHHFYSKIATGFDHTSDSFLVRACHDDYMSSTSPGHHFCFEVSSIHRF